MPEQPTGDGWQYSAEPLSPAWLCAHRGHDETVMLASSLTAEGVTIRCTRCGVDRFIRADVVGQSAAPAAPLKSGTEG